MVLVVAIEPFARLGEYVLLFCRITVVVLALVIIISNCSILMYHPDHPLFKALGLRERIAAFIISLIISTIAGAFAVWWLL